MTTPQNRNTTNSPASSQAVNPNHMDQFSSVIDDLPTTPTTTITTNSRLLSSVQNFASNTLPSSTTVTNFANRASTTLSAASDRLSQRLSSSIDTVNSVSSSVADTYSNVRESTTTIVNVVTHHVPGGQATLIGAGIGATSVIVAIPVALSAAGFTATGIAAGRLAAAAQSALYGGATTSVRSDLTPTAPVGIEGAAGLSVPGGTGRAVVAQQLRARL